MKYIYPAVFKKEEKGFSIDFPDLESCYTQGDDLLDAMEMAEDVLAFTLYRLERSGLAIPGPTDFKSLSPKENQFVTLIKCDTMVYRKLNSKKAVKKTLTIPEWLNEEAVSQEVNFSQVLQEALLRTIHPKEKED